MRDDSPSRITHTYPLLVLCMCLSGVYSREAQEVMDILSPPPLIFLRSWFDVQLILGANAAVGIEYDWGSSNCKLEKKNSMKGSLLRKIIFIRPIYVILLYVILIAVSHLVAENYFELKTFQNRINSILLFLFFSFYWIWLISLTFHINKITNSQNRYIKLHLYCYLIMLTVFVFFLPNKSFFGLNNSNLDVVSAYIAFLAMAFSFVIASKIIVDAEKVETNKILRIIGTTIQFYYLPFSIYFLRKRIKKIDQKIGIKGVR